MLIADLHLGPSDDASLQKLPRETIAGRVALHLWQRRSSRRRRQHLPADQRSAKASKPSSKLVGRLNEGFMSSGCV